MPRTLTINTRTECFGYSDDLDTCIILSNGKYGKALDCDKCRFYKVVPNKYEHWKKVAEECKRYEFMTIQDMKKTEENNS